MTRSHRSSPRRARPRGFVLLLTLVIVSIAAAGLTQRAGRVLSKIVLSERAAESLRVRWARRSLEEALISEYRRSALPPQPSRSLSVRVGDLSFRVLLTDEQAKANLDGLFTRLGPQRLEHALRELVGSAGSRLKVRLRPRPARAPSALPLFASYEDCFDAPEAFELWKPELGEADPAAGAVTCWGDGRINLRAAPPGALGLACSPVLSRLEIARLSRLADEEPGLTPEAAAAALQLDDRRKEAFLEVVCDRSWCVAVWTCLDTANGCRAPSLAVSSCLPQAGEPSDSHPWTTVRFEW